MKTKKCIAALPVVIGVLLCFGCAEKGSDRTKPVFETDGIVSISFREGPGEWIDVEESELSEYAEWLSSFRIGKKAKQPIPPGSNSVTVRVGYGDGTETERGLTTITVGKQKYYLQCGTPPASFPRMLSGTEQ